jgi:hypothetical protein
MPLKISISEHEHLVSIKTEDIVKYRDVKACLEAIRSARAISFRQCFDVRAGYTEMTESDSMDFAGTLNAFATIAPLGPHALVVSSHGIANHKELILQLTLLKRPFRVFHYKMDEALKWLNDQDDVASRGSRSPAT